MKLSSRYNRVNMLTSLLVLILTGIIYYLVIHLILTNKLDRDLAVEEDEIRQYSHNYNKLPLAATYIDQQVSYREQSDSSSTMREFSYTTYYNPQTKKQEPGRSLVTTVMVNGKAFVATIVKSRVEAEDLVSIILWITLSVTLLLLICLWLVNRFVMNRLWKPFYLVLSRMKTFEVRETENTYPIVSQIDEFNELSQSVNAMTEKVKKDYKDLKGFTDNASHEMMTPLAVIHSKLDTLLQTESLTEGQGELLEDIYQATGKLSRLHQTLLLLAKIENNLIPEAHEIDLKEITDAKIRQFQSFFEQDDLEVYKNLGHCRITMNSYLADVLLNNLFSNAIRHNVKHGKVGIQLDNTQLVISNTGKYHDIEGKLFDRFSKSPESEGLGLGLAITRQICNLYGFKIEYHYAGDQHFFTLYFTSEN